MAWFLVAPEKHLLGEIANPLMTRDDVAHTYWLAMSAHFNDKAEVDWKKVNEAIVERWSKNALKYIKKEAWEYTTRP